MPQPNFQSSFQPNLTIVQSVHEFSVIELSNKIKELIENNLGYIRVKGEISGLKIASSGHGYFNLKENTAILACTCWKPVLSKIKFPLADGMEVVVSGKLSGYPGNSRYQLSVEKIDPAGVGAMMQILKERKEKLTKEGIFDKIKKPLPFLPSKIGVITSITGAVIKDIIHRITDRCPSNIIIWPVTVQGENAGNEISNAIDGFNKLESFNQPDVIIVARGGGSIEDLWAFNDEIVIYSAYNSKIPIISAVGHEVDYTLIDLVSDKRAPTPTAAAEFAVPVASILKATLNSHHNVLLNRINQLLKYEQQTVNNYQNIYKHLVNYIEDKQQRLDEISFRLSDSLPSLFKLKTAKLDLFNLVRLNPLKLVSYKSLQLTHQSNYLIKSINQAVNNFSHKLNLNNQLLASLDYNNVLKRGFAIIKSTDGEFLLSKTIAITQEKFNIKFYDGDLTVSNINGNSTQ